MGDKATAAKATKTKEKKEPKRGVGTVAKEAIRAGKTNEQALEAVKKAFPDKNTTMASINWYRNKLRGDGEKVKTAREMKKAVEGDKPKAAAKKAQKDPTA